ncbi:hypothetical protein N2152v2_008018 [Parachlorella kessleri]
MLQAFATGILRGPAQALSNTLGEAVKHGKAQNVAAVTQRLSDLHLGTPLLLRTAAKMVDEQASALTTINLEALQDGRQSVVSNLARDMLRYGYIDTAAKSAMDMYYDGLAAGMLPAAMTTPLAQGSVEAVAGSDHADAVASLFIKLYHEEQQELLAQLQVATVALLGRPDVTAQVAWSLVRRGYQHMVVHVTTRLIAEGEYEVVAAMAEELYATGNKLAAARVLASTLVDATEAGQVAGTVEVSWRLLERGQIPVLRDTMTALVRHLQRPEVAGRLSWECIRRGRTPLVAQLSLALLQNVPQSCLGEDCALVAAELAQATYQQACAAGRGDGEVPRLPGSGLIIQPAGGAGAGMGSTRSGNGSGYGSNGVGPGAADADRGVGPTWSAGEAGNTNGNTNGAFAAGAAPASYGGAVAVPSSTPTSPLAGSPPPTATAAAAAAGTATPTAAAVASDADGFQQSREVDKERHLVSRVLAKSLAEAVAKGCEEAVAEAQVVLWQRGQLGLLRDVLAAMAEEGEARAGARVAWVLLEMGEVAVVVDVSAGLLLGGFPQQAALVVEELYEDSGRNPAVVQMAGESMLAALGRGADPHVVTLMECLLRDGPPGGALHDQVVVWLTDRGYISPFLRVGTAALLGGRTAVLGLLLRRRLRDAGSRAQQPTAGKAAGTAGAAGSYHGAGPNGATTATGSSASGYIEGSSAVYRQGAAALNNAVPYTSPNGSEVVGPVGQQDLMYSGESGWREAGEDGASDDDWNVRLPGRLQ